MENCYIAFGLIDYKPALAWGAALFVFVIYATLGFMLGVNKKRVILVLLFGLLGGVLILFTLVLFGMRITTC